MLSVCISLLLQFLIVWKSPLPMWQSSFAIAKGSPYGLFMRHLIRKMIENGEIHRLISRFEHTVNSQDCKSGLAKGNPLGFKKVSFPFVVALFGFLLSGLIYLCEIIFWTPKSTLDNRKQVNQSKDVLQREIQHLKIVLRQSNEFEWDWLDCLDAILVKIQGSQVHHDQL
jgi:hypothetical protein